MASDGSARKLAVILHADVVGSTALVQRDERIAHDRIQDAFRRFSETISRYGGVAHEIRGDALLAEYNRASDAVSAALAFQAANAEHNNTLDDEIRPTVRIGISLGEVVIADGTLTGPDVVLAQRLEQLAEPGGVCISVEVRHALPGRLPFEYADLGGQEVKGFDEPVRAYAVTLQSGAAIPAPELGARVKKPAGAARRQLVGSRRHCRCCADRSGGGCLVATLGAARRSLLSPAHGVCVARETVGCGAPVRQHDRGSGPGLLRRRNDRGHHHDAGQGAATIRHRA